MKLLLKKILEYDFIDYANKIIQIKRNEYNQESFYSF